MEEYPTRWAADRGAEEREHAEKEEAARFMLNLINATIYSSGHDYDRALRDFFTQVEALGLLIGASDLDEVSIFLRHASRPF